MSKRCFFQADLPNGKILELLEQQSLLNSVIKILFWTVKARPSLEPRTTLFPKVEKPKTVLLCSVGLKLFYLLNLRVAPYFKELSPAGHVVHVHVLITLSPVTLYFGSSAFRLQSGT